jgi:lactoylglutathione lyase
MDPIPAPDFDVPVEWLRCGDLQLHLFQRDIEPANYYHFGLHTDDFEEVYRAVRDGDIDRDFDVVGTNQALSAESPTVYELPDESVQMYVRDPAGNLVEINYHDVNDLDRDIVTDVTPRDEVTKQTGPALESRLYFNELISNIEDQ